MVIYINAGALLLMTIGWLSMPDSREVLVVSSAVTMPGATTRKRIWAGRSGLKRMQHPPPAQVQRWIIGGDSEWSLSNFWEMFCCEGWLNMFWVEELECHVEYSGEPVIGNSVADNECYRIIHTLLLDTPQHSVSSYLPLTLGPLFLCILLFWSLTTTDKPRRCQSSMYHFPHPH